MRNLLVSLLPFAFACSIGSGESTFADPQAAPIAAGSYGGLCVSGASGDVAAQDLAPSCGMSFGGRASAVSIRAVAVAVRIADTGELSASGGSRDVDVADIGVAGIVNANLLSGSVASEGGEAIAASSIADVSIAVAGHTITAAVLQSNAHASCSDGAGSSLVADLRVDGLTIAVTGAPNQTIAVGPVRIVINEQLHDTGAMVVSALHVSATALADVAIATSRASVVCPCGAASTAPPADGSSSGGTSSGGTSSGGASSGGASSGGTSSGGTSSGGSSGTDVTPASDFGQIGDACDSSNTCAPGNHCVLAPTTDVH